MNPDLPCPHENFDVHVVVNRITDTDGGVDETELRAPLRPASADPDFGLGIPGVAIRQAR